MALSSAPRVALALCVALLGGCAQLPASGPSLAQALDPPALETFGIQLVTVDAQVAHRLMDERRMESLAGTFGTTAGAEPPIDAGDAVEVTLWEAPPATLFAAMADMRAGAAGHATTLPAQVVGREGTLRVPFAGAVPARGRSPGQVAEEIVRRLTGKANQPQALVRVVHNASSVVTVVGEVTNSLRVPLTPRGERLLDALAAAGGVRQATHKITVRLTRGATSAAMPLDAIIGQVQENVPLQAGDVITALHRPHAFTALGATGRNEEVEFEAQGISLAQALARVGGLADQRADARGVFVFRFEPAVAADGVPRPVVYRIDLKEPSSFFVAQQFAVRPRDVVYVANAPAAELQKFLNLLLPLVNPTLASINARN